MVNLHRLELQIQQAILLNAVESYKRQHANWLDNPAIRRAILVDAFLSGPGLIIVAATMLAAILVVVIFHPVRVVAATLILVVIILGLVVEVGWLWISLTNKQRQTRAIAKYLPNAASFKLNTIRDEQLKARLFKALHYWWLIDQKIAALPPGSMQQQAQVTHRYVTRWLQTVYTLAYQADKLLLDTIIRQELHTLPAVIRQYEEMLLRENDSALQQQLEHALAHRRQQLQTLQSVQDKLRQTHYKLEGTISALGMVYSQLLLITEGQQQGSQMKRLQADVTEEIDRLQDLTEAMSEVYQEKSS